MENNGGVKIVSEMYVVYLSAQINRIYDDIMTPSASDLTLMLRLSTVLYRAVYVYDDI